MAARRARIGFVLEPQMLILGRALGIKLKLRLALVHAADVHLIPLTTVMMARVEKRAVLLPITSAFEKRVHKNISEVVSIFIDLLLVHRLEDARRLPCVEARLQCKHG